MSSLTLTQKLVILFIVWLILSGPGGGSSKPTAATYVHEKDVAVPAAVLSGLNKLNQKSIVANAVDDDAVDGAGEVPDQYKVPFAKAKELGIPILVATAGDKVTKIVKDPKTEADVLQVAP